MSNSVPGDGAAGLRHAERRSARFAAVQALYQMELTGSDAETVLQEFVDHRFVPEAGAGYHGTPDEEFFGALVRGVPHLQSEIDREIASSLSASWSLKRIDSILRAILRTATCELIERQDTPARVVIDEYVEIANRFFDGDERAFVNAVLDRLARRKRPAEFGLPPSADEPAF
ncbi:MAG TPA: transcription antitermination factor NusB [Rhizomicrobium sp.]|jgi:N utilization substance protein B